MYSQVNSKLGELLEDVREKETRWREKLLRDETEAYKSSHLPGATCTSLEAQGVTAATVSDSAALKDLIPTETEFSAELTKQCRRLDKLRSQLK